MTFAGCCPRLLGLENLVAQPARARSARPTQGVLAIALTRLLSESAARLLASARCFQQAPAGAPEQPNPIVQFVIPMGLVFLIFYFLWFRPEGKRRKAHEAMLKELKNGDRIITTGGIYGVVAGITDELVQLKVSNGVKIDVARSAIAGFQKEE